MKALNNNFAGLTVAIFSAEWSEYAVHMVGVAGLLSEKYPLVSFIQVEAEECEALCEKYNIDSVPIILFFVGKKLVDRIEGVCEDEFEIKIEKYILASSSFQPVNPNNTLQNGQQKQISSFMNEHLKTLINSHPMMVFMKGVPSQPKCKFSRKMMDLFANNGITMFNHFNILEDDLVRENLKLYSNWPTYPQIYIMGEFVGGLDIIEELIHTGDIQELLNKIPSSNAQGVGEMSPSEIISELINSNKVVLFMKGSPDSPQCGFSKTIVELLKEQNIMEYAHFDIYSDEEVRKTAKSYFNWPTFPMLVINAELVGGLDIIRELIENDQLLELLE